MPTFAINDVVPDVQTGRLPVMLRVMDCSAVTVIVIAFERTVVVVTQVADVVIWQLMTWPLARVLEV